MTNRATSGQIISSNPRTTRSAKLYPSLYLVYFQILNFPEIFLYNNKFFFFWVEMSKTKESTLSFSVVQYRPQKQVACISSLAINAKGYCLLKNLTFNIYN